MSEPSAAQHRLELVQDFLAVAERVGEFFDLVARVDGEDELYDALTHSFGISRLSARLLVEMPVRQWAPEGVRRRGNELAALQAKR